MTQHKADRVWIAFILLGWLWLGWPASFWFEVDSVYVDDTVVGEAPHMQVERNIHRAFHADWIVTVMRINASGQPVTWCPAASGHNDYTPEAALPEPLTPDWWMWPAKCALLPGHYVLRTTWTIRPTWTLPRVVRTQSNVFLVRKG